MIEFRTLGRLDLRDAAGAEISAVLAQPKRLALLCYIAGAKPRGYQSRDTLLALFWPSSTATKARAALRQALHELRGALGRSALLTRGREDVALSSSATRCDLWSYEEALERSEFEQAVALYGGPFAPALFVSDAPEFERWLEAERGRLAHRYAKALEMLAKAAEQRGELDAASEWWRRAAEHDPYRSGIAVSLMLSLEAVGNRAAAIRIGEDHVLKVQQDLGAKPNPDVLHALERLKQNPLGHINRGESGAGQV